MAAPTIGSSLLLAGCLCWISPCHRRQPSSHPPKLTKLTRDVADATRAWSSLLTALATSESVEEFRGQVGARSATCLEHNTPQPQPQIALCMLHTLHCAPNWGCNLPPQKARLPRRCRKARSCWRLWAPPGIWRHSLQSSGFHAVAEGGRGAAAAAAVARQLAARMAGTAAIAAA